MAEMKSLSTRIDGELHEVLHDYADRTGRKVQWVVNHALAMWLEDAEDLELIEQRKNEPTVSHEQLKELLEL